MKHWNAGRRSRRSVDRRWLWAAFLLVNLWLCFVAYTGPGYALGDVYLYRWWAELGLGGGPWVGIDTAWVYPALALVPLVIPTVTGSAAYPILWLIMVVALNCLALAALTGWRRRTFSQTAGWWWTGFLLLLGPIAVGRIDSITVPLAIVAMSLVVTRPVVAGILLAAATWIKVWPAALIAAIVLTARVRWHVLLGVVGASFVVVASTIALGGVSSLMSFVTQQTGRGLQIEAPVSTVWLWLAVGGAQASATQGTSGPQESGLYYDGDILTYQVFGPGVEVVARVMTPLLAVVAIVLVMLAVWRLRSGVRAAALLPPFALALVTTLIAFNKVGSPQFIAWLAVPIVFGLACAAVSVAQSFRVPALLTLAIAVLTQMFYPYLYGWLLGLEPVLLAALTARNLLLFVLLGWAIRAMVRVPRQRNRSAG